LQPGNEPTAAPSSGGGKAQKLKKKEQKWSYAKRNKSKKN